MKIPTNVRDALWALAALLAFGVPSALTNAGTYAYITNQGTASVSVINTATNTVVATVGSVGGFPAGVGVKPNGTRVYVASSSPGAVAVINTVTNTLASPLISMSGLSPQGVAVNPAGTEAWVTLAGSNSVAIVDTVTNTVLTSVGVGATPLGVAFKPDGTLAYVTNSSSNDLTVINTATRLVVTTIPVGLAPNGVAVKPDGSRVYVANDTSNSVSVIDTSSNTVVATVPTGQLNTRTVAVNPAGTRLYAVNASSNSVSVIDISAPTPALIGTPLAVGSGPYGIALDPTGARAYVANGTAGTVSVIDTAGPSVVATVTLPGGSGPVAFGLFVVTVPTPGAPTAVSATAGDGQATVTFSPPSDTGSSPITSYTVTSTPSGFTAAGATSPITVTGLTNGVSYTFKVVAANSFGSGPASAASNSVTPMPTVTSDADAGVGTLRAAITQVNAVCPSSPTIKFNIPGGGVKTIQLLAALPPITCFGTTIDGYSQPGSSPNGRIDGGNNAIINIILKPAPSGCVGVPVCDGLQLQGSLLTVMGLSIHSFAGAGIRIMGADADILGNYIGTDPGGETDFGNADWGVRVDSGYAYIGYDEAAARNLITGNSLGGVRVAAGGGCPSVAVPGEPTIAPKGLKIAGAYAELYWNQIGGTRSGGNGVFNSGPGVHFENPLTICGAPPFLSENYIRYNSPGAGVVLPSGAALELSGNNIHGNSRTAFDLGDDGHGVNGTGANGSVKTPVITAVTYNHTICEGTPCVVVNATVTDATRVNHQVSFDFFHNDASPSVPEGQAYVGSSSVVLANASGVASVMFTKTGSFSNAQNVTATATWGSCPSECFPSITSEYSFPMPAPVISLSPSPLAFGSVAVGATSTITLTMTNNGNATLNIIGPVIASGHPDFTVSGCSGAAILPAGTCTVTVSFTPTIPGARLSTLTITSNASGSPHNVSMSGTGATPTASFSTTSLNFGNVSVGTSASQTVTITNTGGATLTLGPISPPGSTAFTASGCGGASLAPGNSCSITVTFTPSSTAPITSSFGITSNATGSPHTVSLSGTGAAPAVLLSPSPLAFANTPVGATSTSTITLTNTGNAPLSFGLNTTVPFAVPAPGFCPNPLPAGGVCSIPMSFTPTAPGPQSGTLTVTSNAAGSPYFVSLTGTGTAPAVLLSPSPLLFGNVPVGTTGTNSITLTNTGDAPLTFGLNTTVPFAVPAPGFCPNPLPAGGVCSIPMSFTPVSPGLQSGTLTVTSNGAGSPHTVSLNGTGTQPGISLAPSPASFGSVVVNTTSTLSIAVNNTGAAPLAISTISVTGSFFTQSGTTCPASLPAGNACAIAIAYSPTATGPHAGQLSVSSNAPGSPHLVALSGTGTAPGVSLTPSPVAFGNVPVGGSASATLNLANTGTAPLLISSITTTGSFFTNTTTCGTSVPAGGSCPIVVSYAPTSAGPHTGQVSVSTNAGAGPVVAPLSGTGTQPGISLTPSSVAFGNVPVGGTASSTLTLANTGTAPMLISGIATTGSFFSQVTACGTSLPPAGTCDIQVTYAPAVAGPHTGQVSVSTNAGPTPVVAPLSGTGAVPVLALTGTGLTFGTQTVGTASLPQTVTINNNGGAPLNITTITPSGDFNFTGCPTPLSIAPGAGCTLSIKFVPTAVGARSGGISIGSNASGTPHAIALTGNGTPMPVPGIALAPGAANFGTLVAGRQTASQVFALSNTGSANLDISSVAIVYIPPPPPVLGLTPFSQTHNCPTSLAPAAACNITVTFAPTLDGSFSGQLQIVSNAAPSPLNAALSGSALPATTAGITLSASSVAFPSQFVGTTSAPRTVTLTSSGTAPLVISQVTGSGDFAFSGCGPSTMAPAATCTFSITFRPQAVGPLTGSIVVTSNAAGSPHTVALSGNGASLTAPEIVIAPSAFAFGTLRTARTASLVGRLSNTGAATLQISQIQAMGAFFTQTNNCPSTIPVGGFCDITVTYSPTATGAHSGQLAIHSNAIPSPHVAALSGTGITVPPPFLSTSAEVSFGQQVTGTTVRRTLVLTNTGGDPLVIGSMAIVGSGAFGIEGGCGTIAPEASCSLTLTFLATGINTFNSRLDIVSNHSGGVVQVRLSGQGVPLPQPDLDFSVGALGFGNQGLNTSVRPGRTVRLTNIGGAPATISAIRSTLADFVLPAGVCVGTMAPGAFCDIEVVFHPIAPGPRQGSLVVDSSPAQTDSVALIGVGCRQSSGLGRHQSPARLCSP